jgi:hypothetical protein
MRNITVPISLSNHDDPIEIDVLISHCNAEPDVGIMRDYYVWDFPTGDYMKKLRQELSLTEYIELCEKLDTAVSELELDF